MRPIHLVIAAACVAAVLTAQNNPVPQLNIPLVPDSIAPSSAAFTLTVNGTGFVTNSVVNWNNSPRATAFVDNSHVTATILASDVAAAGTASITVSNPAPGGGASNVAFFQVTTPSATAAFAQTAAYSMPNPYSVAVADLNGDGKLDLVVPQDTNPGVIEVSLGNGDGTFQPPVAYAAEIGPTAVAIGDFNNDGIPDIAVTCQCTGFVSILLGKGDGTFQPYTSYPTDPDTYSIAVGDFNRDGKLDLVVAPIGLSVIDVLLGNGDGTFQAKTSYATDANPNQVIVGDFNGDGRLDLAVAVNGGIDILNGMGDGSFHKSLLIPGQFSPVAADLNGDGILDLATLGGGTANILLGKGDGTFQAAVNYPAGPAPNNLVAADFNGDGRVDLAVGNFSATYFSVSTTALLLGNGDGTFQTPLDIGIQGHPAGLSAVGDFTSGGRLDLAAVMFPSTGGVQQLTIFQQTAASISPGFLSFPLTLVGRTAASQSVVVTNLGAAQLNISQDNLSGANAADYSLTNDTCQGASIPPLGTCSVSITFSPTAPGARTASFTIADSATGVQLAVLTGLATGLKTTPSKLDFGDQKVGTTSPYLVARITNVTSMLADVNNISITGRDNGDFYEYDTCHHGIKPNATCSVIVQFIPTKKGLRKAEISVVQNVGGANPKRVPILGTGN